VAPRQLIVEVWGKHDRLLIEDASSAFLETDPPPGLFTLAPERTIYVGGISKSLATGLRLGYMIAPALHIDRLVEVIRATTWNTPAVISGLVAGWIEDGTLKNSEDNRRRDGADRQRLLLSSLDGLNLQSQQNAGFAWVVLDKGIRSEPIVANLKERGMATSGAEPFATSSVVPQALRLAFGGIPKSELPTVFNAVREAVDRGSISYEK